MMMRRRAIEGRDERIIEGKQRTGFEEREEMRG